MKKYLSFLLFFVFSFVYSQSNYQDTQGKLEVSNSGSATYTLPIAMPPSIQDVGPVINLIYSSGQMSGIAGQGWSINSISNISRIATRKDIDGFIDGVDFDDNDKLALDGQRLLLVSGAYWADGSTYQTETQSNTKIELFGTGSSIYFVVTLPDGSRSWYGNYGGVSASDNTAFYITRFEDTNGNYITYKYVKPYNKSLCIDEIGFSANITSNILPQNKIKFFYRQAKRTENAFIKGIKQEKVEILEKIEVYTNTQLFRSYLLTHVFDVQLGYEKVIKLQESNGANELANATEFEYNTTTSTNLGAEISRSYQTNLDFQNIRFTGDFDGDGRLDFITDDNKLHKKLFDVNLPSAPITLSFDPIGSFIATTINNNKLNQAQSIVKTFAGNNSSVYYFQNYDFSNNNFVNTYSKQITLNNYPTNYVAPYCGVSEGDFNGDGISEIIATFTSQSYSCPIIYDPYAYNPPCNPEIAITRRLINLNPNTSTLDGTEGCINIDNLSFEIIGKWYINDYNGDGKSDILIINQQGNVFDAQTNSFIPQTDKSYRVFTFNQLNSAPWVSLEKIGEGVLDSYSTKKVILFGDYNGDGKTDIMMPVTDGGSGSSHSNWKIYYSNPQPLGGAFFTTETHSIVEYNPITSETLNDFYALDVNKDGKTDLVRIWRNKYKPQWTINDHDTKWKIFTFINNIGNSLVFGNKFSADYESLSDHNDDSPELPTPIVSTFRFNNINRDIIMIRKHTNNIVYIDFSKDVGEDILMKKVYSSGGNIVNELKYSALEPLEVNNGLGQMYDFYSSGDSVNYPLVEIKRLPATKVVSKLTNISNGVTKHQSFKYHGFVTDMRGMGAIGFRKTARSSWFLNESDKKTWSVIENDATLRGALTRSYTQLTQTNASFSFVSSGNPTGVINSTKNTYVYYTTNGLFTMFLNTQIFEDFLTNVKNEKNFTYLTPYTLEGTVVSKNYLSGVLQGTTTTIREYSNNPTGTGSSYYIGRPTKISTTISAYSDTFSTEEKYTYTGNRLTKTEKKANNTDNVYLTEDFEYFPNGNLKKKTLSAPGSTPTVSARTTEYTYDTTERFVKTIKDIEGLITTNNSYHPLYGLVTKSTNSFGLTTDSEYDNWGKRTKITDYLGKNTYYTYTKSGGRYTTLQTGDDGSGSKVESDVLGRTVRKGVKNINGVWIITDTEYDFLNRKKRESEPYPEGGSVTQWSTLSYDDYNRITQTTSPTGLITNVTYSGLSVTTNDGVKTNSVTKNSNNHNIVTSDNGGVVTNTYYANGNLKTATYSGTVISIEYDGWGRKTKLTDPSAGVYQYEYNVYGETTKEITPNGFKIYTLNNVGKVVSDVSSGLNTSFYSEYQYDPLSKLLTLAEVTDMSLGETFTTQYFYDTQKRVVQTIDSDPYSIFETKIEYDAFGRVNRTYKSGTNMSTGKSSSKWIKNTYKNGFNWQILDDTTNQVLWQANTVNVRDQLTSITLGNGIEINNTYDDYGFPTQFKHDKTGSTTTNVMTLNTSFNTQRGNLTSRYNSLFNWTENFQYDTLDRLTHYPNHNGLTVQQTYESDGRIKQNVLGTYNYNDSAKKYRHSTITTTQSSLSYFENRAGIFNDDFESGSGWIINEPTLISYDNTTAKTGVSSLKINNTGSGEKVVHAENWIKINNAIATQYTYSGWVKSNGPQAEMLLFMKTENETGYFTQLDQILTSPGSNWVYFEKTVSVPANIKKLSVRLDNNGTGTVWFDNVRIRKTTDAVPANRELNISYNMFKSPYQIEETGVDKISFEYNHQGARSNMFYGGLQTDKLQRQYRKHYSADGSMEIKHNTANGEVEIVTYIGGDGYTAPVVLKSNGTTQEYLYLHRDYQGSIVAITNQSGNVVEKRLFDAWGQVIKIQDGQGNSLASFVVLDRGYTGHEHLQSVALIHMNGRLYDPKVHRFLQPDNFIQDPSNTQSFNRYGYVLNNPLKYNDPSGEIGVLAVVGVGMLIGALSYTITALVSDVPFSVGGLLQSVAVSAFTSTMTFGIGEACSTIGNFYLKATIQALSHGTFQGTMSGVQGGNFWTGFASGALASIASSAWEGGTSYNSKGEAIANSGFRGIGGKFADSGAGMITFGTISGGAGAALTDGNFWQGAVTGLVVSGLNHAMHGGFAKKYDLNVLEDYEGANGAGHQALAGELENGKLQYISKDGTNENGGVYGESKYTDATFNNLNEINDYYGTYVSPGKRYDVVATYRLTKSQMNTALTTARIYAHQTYNLFTNSCTTIVEKALYNAFNPNYTFTSPIPNTTFKNQLFTYRDYLISVKNIK
jgi:RHS repeat-associated protein